MGKLGQFTIMSLPISLILVVFLVIIGPSGVRALPLAANINEGGHYFRYFSFL
jgi:hypothetical protein